MSLSRFRGDRGAVTLLASSPSRLGRSVNDVSLNAPNVEGDPLPKQCTWLHVHLREARDGDIERLLAPVNALTCLSLRGTPVSSDLVERLVRRWKLQYLDVVDTLVSEDAVRRIRARYPTLRTHPNPDASYQKPSGHPA